MNEKFFTLKKQRILLFTVLKHAHFDFDDENSKYNRKSIYEKVGIPPLVLSAPLSPFDLEQHTKRKNLRLQSKI